MSEFFDSGGVRETFDFNFILGSKVVLVDPGYKLKSPPIISDPKYKPPEKILDVVPGVWRVNYYALRPDKTPYMCILHHEDEMRFGETWFELKESSMDTARFIMVDQSLYQNKWLKECINQGKRKDIFKIAGKGVGFNTKFDGGVQVNIFFSDTRTSAIQLIFP